MKWQVFILMLLAVQVVRSEDAIPVATTSPQASSPATVQLEISRYSEGTAKEALILSCDPSATNDSCEVRRDRNGESISRMSVEREHLTGVFGKLALLRSVEMSSGSQKRLGPIVLSWEVRGFAMPSRGAIRQNEKKANRELVRTLQAIEASLSALFFR